MTRNIGMIVVLAVLSGCAGPAPLEQGLPKGHQSGEEAALLQAMDRYLTAISKGDLKAMAAMQTPDGMTYQWRPAEDGGMHVTAHPNSFWVDPARDDGRSYRERYWSPHLMIRGGIAVVWGLTSFGSMERRAIAESTFSTS